MALARQNRRVSLGPRGKKSLLTALWPHRIDVLRSRKDTAPHVSGIGLDGGFDSRPKLAVTAHEFWNPGGQSQHVFEYQNLAIAGDAGTDADGGDWNLAGNAAPQRFRDRLDHHRKGAGVGNRDG